MEFQGINRRIEVVQAPRWDDMMTGGLSVALGSTAPSLKAFGPSGNLKAYAFVGTGVRVEECHFAVQLAHSYQEGTTISPHVHWTPSTTDAGDVRWYLDYSWASINGTFGAPQTLDVIQAAGGTAWVHKVGEFPDIVGTGQGISSCLMCRLYRNPADGSDTYEADAFLVQVDIHFIKDTIGSRQEFVK